jgi:hypothetical protein
MQFTSLFTILAVAMTASALPAEQVAPRAANQVASCNNVQSQVCCDGVVGCTLNVLGTTCDGGSYCCDSDAVQVSSALPPPTHFLVVIYLQNPPLKLTRPLFPCQAGLIDVNALNCVELL